MGINNIVIIVALVVMFAVMGAIFCLSAWYGVIDERGRWHRLLLKDIKKDQSLRWTKMITIIYWGCYKRMSSYALQFTQQESIGKSVSMGSIVFVCEKVNLV